MPSSADAQARGGPALDVRAGVVASTPLVTDEMAGEGDVTTSVRPSPLVVVSYRDRLTDRLQLQVEGGWTFGALRGSGPGDSWDGQGVGIGHLTAGVRLPLGARAHARGGIGVLRLFPEDAGVLRGESSLRPLVEAGAGAERPVGGVRVSADLAAQAHRFGTAAIRELGGADGSVIRAALTIGIGFGGTR